MLFKILRGNLNGALERNWSLGTYILCNKNQIRFASSSNNANGSEEKRNHSTNNRNIFITKITQILQCEARHAYAVYKEIKAGTPTTLAMRVQFLQEHKISRSTIIEYPFLLTEDLGKSGVFSSSKSFTGLCSKLNSQFSQVY